MAYDKNIEQIRGRGYHYLVAARAGERWKHEPEFVEEAGNYLPRMNADEHRF